MILATVQGINPQDKQVVAKDGVVLLGSEADKSFAEMMVFLQSISKEQGEYIINKKNKTLCFVYHPIKDCIGRKRIVTMIWDNRTDINDIKKTFLLFDIPPEKFDGLNKKKTKIKKIFYIIFLFALIGVLCLWSWLW